MAGTINFLVFWAVFLGLLFWFEGQMGISVLSGSNFSGNTIENFLSFFSLNSGYGLVNIILVSPLLMVGTYLVICLIRGVPPV
jgi:hypothetical protein